MKDEHNISLEYYKKMVLIRQAEQYIISCYDDDEMKTPMHMSMGSEALVVGVCQGIGSASQVFGTYRSHANYLAVSDDIDSFFAELFGKATSAQRGIAGSMHMAHPESGYMFSSAIVASTISLAVGAAYANKMCGRDQLVAVFFGDGAVDEGVFWESINLAALMTLPILFVCEDNQYAINSGKSVRRGYDELSTLIAQYNVMVAHESTTDVEKIGRITEEMSKAIREENRPGFLQLEYYRYLEHVGVKEDFHLGFRKESEYQQWLAVDPIAKQREVLLKQGFQASDIENIDREMIERVEQAADAARHAPNPAVNDLYRDTSG